MIYISLFFSFFQIGLFAIGGGYAAMPLIAQQTVEIHKWLTMSQFTDLVTIAEMTPGPIAINAATFVGTRMAGLTGAVSATFGCILPSCLIVSFLSFIYRKYKNASGFASVLSCLRPTVVALILSAGIAILKTAVFKGKADVINACLFVCAFIVLRKFKTNPILVMSLCGAAGLVANLIARMA